MHLNLTKNWKRNLAETEKSNQNFSFIFFTCSRAIWNQVFAIMLSRFAWFVCVVLMAKKMSSNWMAVGFGVTVMRASFVIWPLCSFVVTSFSHGNCVVGVKFRWNPSKLPSVECRDSGALSIWEKRTKKREMYEANQIYSLLVFSILFDGIRFDGFDCLFLSFPMTNEW